VIMDGIIQVMDGVLERSIFNNNLRERRCGRGTTSAGWCMQQYLPDLVEQVLLDGAEVQVMELGLVICADMDGMQLMWSRWSRHPSRMHEVESLGGDAGAGCKNVNSAESSGGDVGARYKDAKNVESLGGNVGARCKIVKEVESLGGDVGTGCKGVKKVESLGSDLGIES